MQCSDVTQHDWHAGQILCNLCPSLSSSSSPAHAVLIDLSATLQTLDLNVNLAKDDYGRCVSAITHENITGLDPKWVCEYYWDRDEMKREIWDVYRVGIMRNGYHWSSKREEPIDGIILFNAIPDEIFIHILDYVHHGIVSLYLCSKELRGRFGKIFFDYLSWDYDKCPTCINFPYI